MELINKLKIDTSIGFDIGDGITNVIINRNEFIPIENTEKFIIKDFDNPYISIYEGVNTLSKNNNLINKIKLLPNKLYFLNIKVICKNLIVIKVYDKSGKEQNFLNYIENYNLENEESEINFNKIKLIYIFKIVKKNILKKIINFPEKIKFKVTNKINEYDNNINTFETQQIIEKINLLKNKFLV